MKTIYALLGLALASTPAFADGFVCHGERDGLTIQVYNQTRPEAGTRNGAALIVSSDAVGAGRKTIARFTEANLTLGNEASVYTAKVDHRFNDSNRKGELIGGTKLGFLQYLVLNLDFTYARPVADGAPVRGDLTLVKRNGEQIAIDMDCARYLKN
jgi:hypothetical protein